MLASNLRLLHHASKLGHRFDATRRRGMPETLSSNLHRQRKRRRYLQTLMDGMQKSRREGVASAIRSRDLFHR